MDLYIMPLILGAAIGLAGGELSFFLQMSFFACGIATILQAGFFMKYPIIQGPSYVPLGALCTIGATMGVSAMIGSLIPGAIMIILRRYHHTHSWNIPDTDSCKGNRKLRWKLKCKCGIRTYRCRSAHRMYDTSVQA